MLTDDEPARAHRPVWRMTSWLEKHQKRPSKPQIIPLQDFFLTLNCLTNSTFFLQLDCRVSSTRGVNHRSTQQAGAAGREQRKMTSGLDYQPTIEHRWLSKEKKNDTNINRLMRAARWKHISETRVCLTLIHSQLTFSTIQDFRFIYSSFHLSLM